MRTRHIALYATALALYATLLCSIGLWRAAPYPVLAFALHSTGWAAVRRWFMLQDFAAVERETDRARERLLIALTVAAMVLLPVLTIVTPLLDHLAYPPFPGQAALGLTITLAALLLLARAHAEIGTNWAQRLQTRANHRLVTTGPYAHILMQARFGADYTTYCARTPRLIPRFGRFRQKGT